MANLKIHNLIIPPNFCFTMFRGNLVPLKNGLAFHTTCIFNGQSARAMRKIIGGSKKKKYHFTDVPTLPSTSNIFGKTSFETKVTGNPRRSLVLNKLFMRHITDLMATSEYSNQIVGYGIEVNKVQITSDYNILKVYWIAKNSEDLQSIENTLIKNAGLLRHELSQLRVMGEVPNIVFVKDKTYSKIAEVEGKLAVADFGEDYQRIELAENITSSYEIWNALDSTVKAKLKILDSKSEKNDENDLLKIPSMPQNVLGLDHADILNSIRKRMTTSEALHRNDPTKESGCSKWSKFKMTQPVNANPVAYNSQHQQRQAFKQFLQQRQILKLKESKVSKSLNPELELLKETMNEAHLASGNFEISDQEDDFILEHFEDSEGSVK